MRRRTQSRRTPHHALVAAAAGALLASCASTAKELSPTAPPVGASIDELAGELVASAGERAHVGAMRVYLHPLSEVDPRSSAHGARASHAELAYLGQELSEELLVALSARLHMIDAGFAEGELDAGQLDRSAAEVAESLDATHVVAGTFASRGAEVLVSLRLVDAETRTIVAASRGTLPVGALSDRSRIALGDPGFELEPGPSLAAAPAARETWNVPAEEPPRVVTTSSRAGGRIVIEDDELVQPLRETDYQVWRRKYGSAGRPRPAPARTASRRGAAFDETGVPEEGGPSSGPAALRLAATGRALPTTYRRSD